jgi:hypothetical protein
MASAAQLVRPTRGRADALAAGPRSDRGSIAWERNKGDLRKLIKYWTVGLGAARIGWGRPCDFCSCFNHLLKYIKDDHETRGFCARLHHRVLGVWPGREDHHGHTGRHCPC